MNYLEACDIIGASPNDDLKTIKSHYKSKIKFYHPDNYQGDKEKLEYAEATTKKLNEAWECVQKNYDNPRKTDTSYSYENNDYDNVYEYEEDSIEVVTHTCWFSEFKIFLIAFALVLIAVFTFCVTERLDSWTREKQQAREYSQYIESLSEDDMLAFETYKFTSVGDGYSISVIDTNISGSITIPEKFEGIPIVAIGASAFENCTDLEEVIMPDSIMYLGAKAFSGCTSLSNVKFSNSLKEIDYYAFLNCVELESAQLPDSVEKIGSKAFKGCQNLSSINIPTSLTEIVNSVFSECSSLKIVYIPATVKEVDIYAFEKCSGIEEIIIEPGVKQANTIYPVFTGCSNVKKASIPASWLAKLTGNNFEEITITDTIDGVRIPTRLSARCIKLEDGIELIDTYEFYYLDVLKEIYLPASIKAIQGSAITISPNVSDIYYDGTLEEWNEIEFGKGWKREDQIITIHCTDGIIEE